ncbi:spermidine synthase [Winogradskyella sp.]|uniref:spermidine synthase n=1 Tax=Winogradskyella sp. TaxID=1883156 RepID=UPI003F6AF097
MKRLLSYIYPVTKTIESQHSGMLEITWYNGKKHLNSKNANYSYGSLQRILKFGIEKIDLKKVNSVLVLGMGGGSVIETLRKDFNFQQKITAVEIDASIIEIAKTEFGITENEKLKIYCLDAIDFIKTNTELFDLIIIDLFIDLTVPNKFQRVDFWKMILKSKSSKGDVIFNADVVDNKSNTKLDEIISFLKSKVYDVSVYEKVNNTNTVIVANGL